MGKNGANSNPHNLSSKKGSPFHKRGIGPGSPSRTSRGDGGPDPGREVERLQAALEVERGRNQQARRRFSLELRRQRDEAREERVRALKELTSRHEQQKALELLRQREALGRERSAEIRRLQGRQSRQVQDWQSLHCVTLNKAGELHRRLADDISGILKPASQGKAGKIEPWCEGNGTIYRKLEELLKVLHGEAEGEQAVLLQRLRHEVELEKSFFLCHLLEAHGLPAQDKKILGKKQDGQKGRSSKGSRLRSKSCVQFQSGSPKRSESFSKRKPPVARSRSLSQQPQSSSPSPMRTNKQDKQDKQDKDSGQTTSSSSPVEHKNSKGELPEASPDHSSPDVGWDIESSSPSLEKLSPSRCSEDNMEDLNGTDYDFLVRQNSELLRALEDLEKTCSTLREENILLRKSSCPETEEKVKRLRRKNTELAVIAKRLEDRARKLQEANLKVVNAPLPVKPGAVEQYKRAFARQRARDLAQHADTLLSKDKEIAALQQECRRLEARTGLGKGVPGLAGAGEFERLLKESQKEVLRLQRQLSVSSAREQAAPAETAPEEDVQEDDRVVCETPSPVLDEAPVKGEKTPGEEEEESRTQVTVKQDSHQEECTQEERLQFLESELSKKRKECEGLEHEVRKRQKRCLDLESQLEDERSRNALLTEEAELLRRKAQLLDQSQVENEELREELSAVSAQHSSVLEENQKLRAKLENLEQVLKHMREVAERRQQLELEHEQALAILKFKQDEIKRLQRAQLFAKREHEGVVQMLESKVRELEDKCRNQSEQFGLLSQELDKFRQQASKIDLSAPSLLSHSLSQLPNGIGLTGDTGTSASWDDIAFWSLEGNEALCDASEQDVAAVLRAGSTPHAAGLSRPERSPATKHRELPSLSLKSTSTSSPSPPKSETTHLSPKSAAVSRPVSPRRASPTHEVDTASEVEELDIDVSPAPVSVSRGPAKLQVFIARYSYNPYDGPNDNPEVELPLTAGEYIYVYGDMDDDGFYEGELMDGRRGLVPSNFVERVSDDDVMSAHHHEAGDLSHNSFQESSFHSGSERLHQHHLRFAHSASERSEASASAPTPAVTTDSAKANAHAPILPATPLTNGLDLDLEEVGADTVPYPRKITLIKQLAKSIIIGWEPPLVPVGWGAVWSYNVYVDQELRLNVPFGAQTKAVLERLELGQKGYRVAVQSLTERGGSDQLRCSMLVGRDVSVAPTQLRVERVTATSACLSWLPSNSNYVHIVSLNNEECELVKAGCYSLCLSNLTPSLHYCVKVEARPHRTPWELPVEQRERKSVITSFTTLSAGPPDAPLDVQLEHGPSPGIAQISWLPVTIDAAGTSNGVRVTGYTIYADKKKVLEVSSPTAGSALIGPSQIQTLQAAREITVRTMSPNGESVDSAPVNVPAKLPAIMAGTSMPLCQSVPAHASVLTAGAVTTEPAAICATSLSAAKTPTMPLSSVPDAHSSGSVRGIYTNMAKATDDAPLPAATIVEAWANPAPVAPLAVTVAVQEARPVPVANSNPLQVSVPVPVVVPVPVPVPGPALVAVPLAATSPAPVQPSVMPAVTPAAETSRDTDSPRPIRAVASISDFLEDARAKLHTPPPAPNMPKVNTTGPDLLNLPDTHPLRPPNPSPLESEPEDDRENTRLASIEEFLRPEPQPRIKIYAGGLMDPPPDYPAESSRSDLSDILEEEEEDLYSESTADVSPRNYIPRPVGRSEVWEPDSDEEVLEKILKIHPQAFHNKQLFSIPEVTEEEDNTDTEPHCSRLPRTPGPLMRRPRLEESYQRGQEVHRRPQLYRRAEVREPTARTRQGGAVQVRPRPRVHYADTVDTINYEEDEEVELDSDSSLYAGPCSREVTVRRPQRTQWDSDRLRREAMLRSQMTSDLMAVPPGTAQGPYMLSRTVHRVKSPTGSAVEIDVEYGTDDEPAPFDPGEVVVDQMSSEWWVEGGSHEYRPTPLPRRLKQELPVIMPSGHHSWETSSRDVPLGDAGAAWCPPRELSPKLMPRMPKDVGESRPVGENEVRVFVALFPYDPVTMSPNRDAAEEELPFREGQIIKVYGDKDADGFYRGESGGRHGYVPCNMVSEIQVDDEETKDQLLRQGFLSTEASMEKIGTRSLAQLPHRPAPPPKPRRSKKVETAGVFEDHSVIDSSSQDNSRHSGAAAAMGNPGPRRMVAIFDYDPRESSPNADVEAELTFSAGDIIYVFGDMDDDGFFYGDLNGQKGLVPSNFLQAFPETVEEAAAAAPVEHPVAEPRRDSQVSCSVMLEQTDAVPPAPSEESPAAQSEPNQHPDLHPNQHPEQHLNPKPDSVHGLGPSAPCFLQPTDSFSPTVSDCSPPEKKKKGFFSKGKKLFKKLGSSKKE
ncbi:peripheral-type benzodiazepine receptor-associated protein 1 isoform X2 [Astyanax mexicanus]|uniref:peripheral-type benzodiazepine receptor-associated protein 1 isoform X2 n=1 Tax=Astyanax mexicanus TaxID=7994 RepID=UPI0020CB23DB|nr:peripheral-type benzodiazepine receptor-associated protein 1 isoform X2 [Astyanax mexicanus]